MMTVSAIALYVYAWILGNAMNEPAFNGKTYELVHGKYQRAICPDVMSDLYAYGAECWNEQLHELQPKAILKRLAKLEAKSGQSRRIKVAKKSSKRKG